MMLAGRLSNRVDPRWLMLIGVAMLAAYFRDGCFVAADSFPDLSSPELRAGLRAAVAA